MYINRGAIRDFPFTGVFYVEHSLREYLSVYGTDGVGGDALSFVSDDGELLHLERDFSFEKSVSERLHLREGYELHGRRLLRVLLRTRCDIQRSARMMNRDTIMADMRVFFPCAVNERLPIGYGSFFQSKDYVIDIQGRVVSLEYSQLGGAWVDIRVGDLDDGRSVVEKIT